MLRTFTQGISITADDNADTHLTVPFARAKAFEDLIEASRNGCEALLTYPNISIQQLHAAGQELQQALLPFRGA